MVAAGLTAATRLVPRQGDVRIFGVRLQLLRWIRETVDGNSNIGVLAQQFDVEKRFGAIRAAAGVGMAGVMIRMPEHTVTVIRVHMSENGVAYLGTVRAQIED